jgi:hypothetical protein
MGKNLKRSHIVDERLILGQGGILHRSNKNLGEGVVVIRVVGNVIVLTEKSDV